MKRESSDGLCIITHILGGTDAFHFLAAQLIWTLPVEPASQCIAFAPNVTPVTFNDPPPPLETTFEPVLFPTPTGECSSRRPTHSKKRPNDHIPRPPNAFILFRSSFIKSQHVSTGVETNHSTLSKIIGLTWQNMPHDERQIWHAKAKKALEDHRRKWPQYAFRPSHTKAKGGSEKRKVREVEPKDMKRCAKIAELLVEGKKGQELEDAIQEFDRTHVPEVITRFEAPITARAYRRSSSAPIDNLEIKKPFLSSSSSSSSSSSPPPSPAPRRVRCTSSQPPLQSTWKSQGDDDLTFGSDSLASEHCFDISSPSSFISSDYSFPAKPQPSMVSHAWLLHLFNFNIFMLRNLTHSCLTLHSAIRWLPRVNLSQTFLLHRARRGSKPLHYLSTPYRTATGRQLHHPTATLLSPPSSIHLSITCAQKAKTHSCLTRFPSTCRLHIPYLATDSRTVLTNLHTPWTHPHSRMKISFRKTNFRCSSRGNSSLPARTWSFPPS